MNLSGICPDVIWRIAMGTDTKHVVQLRAALNREVAKLVRQEDAIGATTAMIALIEGQIKLAEK